MKAISIQQPWAWLIVNGFKDIENRSWATNYRGPVLIHTGLRTNKSALRCLSRGCHPVIGETLNEAMRQVVADSIANLPLGGIVGQVDIVNCINESESDWWMGPYGFVLRNAKPLPFQACRGQLMFFEPDFAAAPAKVLAPERQGVLF